jgi:hypothetical protein
MTDHLAQLNIGMLRAPLDSPELAGFVGALDEINKLAEEAPGFVWRLISPDGNDATAIRPFDEANILINCSVWASREALWDFVYRTGHLDFMRRRREWFHRMVEAYQVLWWVPVGHRPSVEEAIGKLDELRRYGPGPGAFTFREP